MKFEWYLVQTDNYGNPLSIELIGEGLFLTLQIPDRPMQYRLYLEGIQDGSATVDYSTLHTPLY